MKRTIPRRWWRRCSQLISLALFGYILWSTTYPLHGPVAPTTYFVADPLLSISVGLSEAVWPPGLPVAVLMLVIAAVFGRVFCGWICPLGTMFDLVGRIRPRSFGDPLRGKRHRRIKRWVLVSVILAAVAGVQMVWFLDPTVLAARFISLNFVPAVSWALDSFLSSLIRTFHWYGRGMDLYRVLKQTVLGVQVYFFNHAAVVLAVTVGVSATALYARRFWCRVICPLGALYGLCGAHPLWERRVAGCISCGACEPRCRTAAIRPDMSYRRQECIVCMECVDVCPVQATQFGWRSRPVRRASPAPETGSTRREVLSLLAAATAAGAMRIGYAPGRPRTATVLRPPAALPEAAFLDRCVRCGNCMKVCPTNGLQPMLWEGGWGGLWTPRLSPDIGYCEYTCTLCGQVCPTGAIPRISLPQKKQVRMGVADIDRRRCLAWAEQKGCLVCEEHCPVPEKAIKIEWRQINGESVGMPVVDAGRCIGCGICQTKCPVRPHRAITVGPLRERGADR